MLNVACILNFDRVSLWLCTVCTVLPQVMCSVQKNNCDICKQSEAMLASCHSRSASAGPLTAEGKCRSIYLFRPPCSAISTQVIHKHWNLVLIKNLISEYAHSFYRVRKSSKWNQRAILHTCFRIQMQIPTLNLPKPQRIFKQLSIEFAISMVCFVYPDLARLLLLTTPGVHD